MEELDSVQFLSVKNGTDRKISGRFHGEDYVLKPGESVTMPVEAAAHIFGFGVDDKTPALHRLGWLTASQHAEVAMERLSKLGFEPVHQVFELETERRSRGKKGRRGEIVDSAVEDVEDVG